MNRTLTAVLVLAFAWPAAAQQAGGLPLPASVGKGPTGLARPLSVVPQPLLTAADVQSALLGANGNGTQNQGIGQQFPGGTASLSGGAGWYGNGGSGASRRPTVVVNKTFNRTFDNTLANTFNAPVAITHGNGNNVQIQSASGSGPIALQQVTGSQAGGAVNTAVGGTGAGLRRSSSGGAVTPAVARHVRVAPLAGQ